MSHLGHRRPRYIFGQIMLGATKAQRQSVFYSKVRGFSHLVSAKIRTAKAPVKGQQQQ